MEADPLHLCWGPYNDISGKIVLAESDSRCGFEDQVKINEEYFSYICLTFETNLKMYAKAFNFRYGPL